MHMGVYHSLGHEQSTSNHVPKVQLGSLHQYPPTSNNTLSMGEALRVPPFYVLEF